jgi:hypothetical protein
MIIAEKIVIHAPLSRVWQVFSNLSAWGQWNSVCQDCCLISGEAMAAGTCFSFKLRPYYLPIKIDLHVTTCDPGREIVWEGERLGVRGLHRFEFKEEDGHVLLTSIENLSGPLFFLSRLLLVPHRLHQLSRQLLQAVKEVAEACGTDEKRTL